MLYPRPSPKLDPITSPTKVPIPTKKPLENYGNMPLNLISNRLNNWGLLCFHADCMFHIGQKDLLFKTSCCSRSIRNKVRHCELLLLPPLNF
jgi:hypothetical protein